MKCFECGAEYQPYAWTTFHKMDCCSKKSMDAYVVVISNLYKYTPTMLNDLVLEIKIEKEKGKDD